MTSLKTYINGLLIWALFAVPVYAQQDTSREDLVKAAFILNFIRFITWPAKDDDATTREQLTLCTMNGASANTAISQLNGRTVRDLELVVEVSATETDFENCDIFFFEEKGQLQHDSTMSRLSQLPILTIGDYEGFIEDNGLIEFIRIDAKVAFEINATRARKHGIMISSKLLSLARNVQ